MEWTNSFNARIGFKVLKYLDINRCVKGWKKSGVWEQGITVGGRKCWQKGIS
jgi:hypothetical protein